MDTTTATSPPTAPAKLAAEKLTEGTLIAVTTTADADEPTFYRFKSFTEFTDGTGGGGMLTVGWPNPVLEHVNVVVFLTNIVELREMTDAEFAAQGWGF